MRVLLFKWWIENFNKNNNRRFWCCVWRMAFFIFAPPFTFIWLFPLKKFLQSMFVLWKVKINIFKSILKSYASIVRPSSHLKDWDFSWVSIRSSYNRKKAIQKTLEIRKLDVISQQNGKKLKETGFKMFYITRIVFISSPTTQVR